MGAGDYQVTLDGEVFSPRFLSLNGHPEEPGPGDLLITRAVPPIVLGQTTAIKLRNTGEATGLVMLETGPGPSLSKIACRVGNAWIKRTGGPPSDSHHAREESDDDEDAEQLFVNPLVELSTTELELLRGIRLEAWDPSLETHIRKIDTKQCAISIDSEVLRAFGGRLPPLPQNLHYLILDFSSWSTRDKFDLSSLLSFPDLRVLVLPSAEIPIDIAFLAQAKHLRVLHLSGTHVSGLQQLSALQELRDLNLANCDSVDDSSWSGISNLTQLRRLDLAGCGRLTSIEGARSLAALESIDISGTAITDLTCFADMPSLKQITAIRTPVEMLPKRKLLNLLSVNVMSTGLTLDVVAEFRRLHPDASVRHGWVDALRETLSHTDHVRVRSGGTCHRNRDEERTLADEPDGAAVEKLVLSFEVDERKSGGHCMCCGDPTLEFRRGGELLAEIGLHHGRSARWKGWPGDAALSLGSRDKVAAWLVERGDRSFWEAHQETRALEIGEKALVEDCLSVLPPRCAEFWRTGTVGQGEAAGYLGMLDLQGDTPSVVTVRGPSMLGEGPGSESHTMAAAIRKELRDPIKVAAVAFRLLGCGQGSWNQVPHGGLHRIALDLLKAADSSARGSAVRLVAPDPNGWEGAVRWLVYHGGFGSVPKDMLSEQIGRVIRHGLSHPREFNRHHTLALMGTEDGSFVISMLREVLNGLPVRRVDPRHATEPGGMVVTKGGRQPLPDGASDGAFAAQVLAGLGDSESYVKICELALTATGPSQRVFLEAKATLDRRAVGKKKSLLARARALLVPRARRSDAAAQKPREGFDAKDNGR